MKEEVEGCWMETLKLRGEAMLVPVITWSVQLVQLERGACKPVADQSVVSQGVMANCIKQVSHKVKQNR